MKKTEFQDRLSAISVQAAEQNKGTFGEVQMLFDELAGEAQRQGEIERQRGSSRPPLLKLLLGLMFLSILSAAAVGIYGIYHFPDAPLRRNGETYSGKNGQPRTKEDFERFGLWKNALFISFTTTFTLGLTFTVLDTRQRRRHKLNG